MSNLARSERLRLASLLRSVGPEAPTLCEGWNTTDLAVHLVMRDRDLPALVGEHVGLFSKRHERVAQSLRDMPWNELVGRVAEGPQKWMPAAWGPAESLMNTAEFLVHHEDVRRAQPGWRPRSLGADVQEEMHFFLKGLIFPTALRKGLHLIVRPTGFDEIRAGLTSRPTRTLTGTPVELLLYVYGREDHAEVDVRDEEPLAAAGEGEVVGEETADPRAEEALG